VGPDGTLDCYVMCTRTRIACSSRRQLAEYNSTKRRKELGGASWLV